MSAVAEIQPEDINPGVEQGANQLGRGRRRAEGRNDFGAAPAPHAHLLPDGLWYWSGIARKSSASGLLGPVTAEGGESRVRHRRSRQSCRVRFASAFEDR